VEHKWYIVHTYSGFEHKVKLALEEHIKSLGKEDLFSDILVPTEKVVELVKGERKTSSRKFYPGYILVRMELNDETWHLVKDTPKVTGFIGEKNKPVPIPDAEAQKVIEQMAEGAIKPKPKFFFEDNYFPTGGNVSRDSFHNLRPLGNFCPWSVSGIRKLGN